MYNDASISRSDDFSKAPNGGEPLFALWHWRLRWKRPTNLWRPPAGRKGRVNPLEHPPPTDRDEILKICEEGQPVTALNETRGFLGQVNVCR